MDVYALPVPGSGGKTCAQIFEEAGCDTPASPSCGACLGGPRDTYARMNEPQVSYAYFCLRDNWLMIKYGLHTLMKDFQMPTRVAIFRAI